ncbi:protein kinase [Thermodesulfobacteriota bacterium]
MDQKIESGNIPPGGKGTPKKVGRHTIFHELGRGAMGSVLLGHDPYVDRLVAIKTSLQSRSASPNQQNTFHKSFFHEARMAGKLNHPNIVSVYDVDVADNTCYIAMEHVDGPTLKDFCKEDDLLPIDRVVDIIYDCCKGLDYAHNKGIVHWDIKPANIMINSSGIVKITDFGISRMAQEALSEAIDDVKKDNITGTFSYMSPQHIKEPSKVDRRNDIFSIGCVLYELLTGQKAFKGDNYFTVAYKVANQEPVSILDIRSELPEILEGIVKKAITKEPDKRYQTGMEFAYDLKVASRHLNPAKSEMPAEDVIDYVCNTPFFSEFSRDHVKEILSASSIMRVSEGSTVVSEGDIDDTLFVILSGSVDVIKNNTKIDTIDQGECFGELAYLSGHPRAATLIASTNCIFIKISATLMEKISETIQLLFLKSMALALVDRIAVNHKLIVSLLNEKS